MFLAEITIYDVQLLQNSEGKASGEAYIQLENNDMKAALKKHRNYMGRRYVEVFTISGAESSQMFRRMKRRTASNQETIRAYDPSLM